MTNLLKTESEWSLALSGVRDSLLGADPEFDELTEDEARRRKERWNALHPHVKTTLRWRIRETHVGEWRVAE